MFTLGKTPSYADLRDWCYAPPAADRGKPEILAPANALTYKTAVYNGADAIYFGYGGLNARAGGDNFDSLKEVVDFCHIYGVKAYLALNIALKTSELEKAKAIIIQAEEVKIDAFIISDLSLVPLIKRYSRAQIHASTQMGIHNLAGLRFLQGHGFDRAVLSREAEMADIKKMKEESPLELEIFVHGALCVCFSGGCLMSSILTGNSGNRGRCSQLCRHKYAIICGDKKTEGYMLSAKDICAINNIDKLKEIGIDSFKIEGRLRRAAYAGGTAQLYKLCTVGAVPNKEDIEILKKLYNRGDYTVPFLTRETVYPNAPGHIGLRCGRIVKALSDERAVIKADFKLCKGDGLKIFRDGLEVSGGTVTGCAERNCEYFAAISDKVSPGDFAHITTDTKLNSEITDKFRRIKADIAIRIAAGERVHIIASSQGVTTEIYSENLIDSAQTSPLAECEIKEQFSKTGDTVFDFRFINIVTENAFMPKSVLNAFRREICTKLFGDIINSYQRPQPAKYQKLPKKEKSNVAPGDFCEISHIFAATPRLTEKIKNIVYSPAVFLKDDCQSFYQKVKSDNLIFIKFPIFIPESMMQTASEILEIFDGAVANNLGIVQLAKEQNKLIIAGYNLNVTNTSNPLIAYSDRFIASVELNKRELKPFSGALLYTYGHLPLMYLNHCPHKLIGQSCGDCAQKLTYKDEKGTYSLFTQKFGTICVHTLKNGILTSLGNVDGFDKYFDFSEKSVKEIDEVVDNYYNGLPIINENCNKLHLSRGVK